jgi:hypothetical protein
VPDHNEVRIGTLLSIIRQSGLPHTPTGRNRRSAVASATTRFVLINGTVPGHAEIMTWVIKRGETTVLVLTGTGLKASERIGQLLKVGARSEE